MKAAERERNKQKRTRIDDDVDQLIWTMACVLIPFNYCEPATVPLAVRARMHLVCSVCSMRLYFNEVIRYFNEVQRRGGPDPPVVILIIQYFVRVLCNPASKSSRSKLRPSGRFD